MKRSALQNQCEYLAFRALAGFIQCLPIDAALALGGGLSRLWPLVLPKHKRRILEHLQLCLGDELSPDEREKIAVGCLDHWTRFAMELLHGPNLIHRWSWNRYIEPVNLREGLDYLLSGKPAILVTGHFGNWELVGHLIAGFGLPIAAVMRPLDNPLLNRFVVKTRSVHGLRLIDKRGAVMEAEKLIKNGVTLAFIADQDAGRKGVFVDFFGQPASTYKSIGFLALQHDIPILAGYARRIGPGFRYEVGIETMIRPEEWKGQDDPLRWVTQRYMSAIEASARRDLAQYLWIHRRWKSRPRRHKPILENNLELSEADSASDLA